MNKIILITTLITFIIKLTRNQSIPSIPCPNLFSYVVNSQTGRLEGRITVTDTRPGIENLIVLRMLYPFHIVNSHPGTISPTRNSRDIVYDIQQKRPVVYRVTFPTTNPVPSVYEIMHNGRTICRNRYRHRGDSEILLHFSLVVPNIHAITYSGPSSNSIQIPRQKIPSRNTHRQPTSRNSFTDNATSCGTSIIPVQLIVGGIKMQPGTWPWLAAIFKRTTRGQYKYTCGGSIVAPHVVLTAAHCVTERKRVNRPQDVVIGLGLYEIYRWNEPNTYIANVYNIIPHSDYGHTNRVYDADVAIIVLDRSYSYNQRVRPICMWSGSSDLNHIVNEQGHVAGWGVAKSGGGTEQLPNIVETEVVSTDRCRNSNSVIRDLISNRNFCAGYLNGHGPCKGDSGSGLMIERGGKWYLRGIVSGALGHIKKVCDLNEYVIYTDVAKFVRWIKAHVTF